MPRALGINAQALTLARLEEPFWRVHPSQYSIASNLYHISPEEPILHHADQRSPGDLFQYGNP